MHTNGQRRFRFKDFELDSAAGKLFRNGQPVKIQPQPLRVLEVLLERQGEIVSRDELRARVWGETTFVEFDQALNYSIRQIRLALRDEASETSYIETFPKQGYRLIATAASHPVLPDSAPPPTKPPSPPPSTWMNRKRIPWAIAAFCVVLAAVTGWVTLHPVRRIQPSAVKYTPLTDFTDSAVAPALSPDGRMLAFIRGGESFLSADQVYVKILPNGEARRLTDDPHLKYNLAFSPDGSQIAYTVLEPPGWSTYIVSVLGGDSHLLMKNAAGLTWLDQTQLLFSQIRSGVHLGVVTGTSTRDHFRELYYPPHERGMAHYSYASPDHTSALVVEMKGNGDWGPCLLISLTGTSQSKPVGPDGPCTSAGWSPDGAWMYFIAVIEGQSHLWRQRFSDGRPEQITFGPAEEDGLAVERDGRSVITSLGVRQSAIWIHDSGGERSLSSEGEVVSSKSPPLFSADNKVIYSLIRHPAAGSGKELWRTLVASSTGGPPGKTEAVFPGVSMTSFDISPDGKQVVYSTAPTNQKSQLWLAPIDRSSPATRIADTGENAPHFGPHGHILFSATEGNFNYLEQMNQDGSGRTKVVPYPINGIHGISPGRRWVTAVIPFAEGRQVGVVAIPAIGGAPIRLCASYCAPIWSPNGKYLFVPVEAESRTTQGRSLAIPLGADESLPPLPDGGIKPQSGAEIIPGARSVNRAYFIPGNQLDYFAYVNTTEHRNLYRISLP